MCPETGSWKFTVKGILIRYFVNMYLSCYYLYYYSVKCCSLEVKYVTAWLFLGVLWNHRVGSKHEQQWRAWEDIYGSDWRNAESGVVACCGGGMDGRTDGQMDGWRKGGCLKEENGLHVVTDLVWWIWERKSWNGYVDVVHLEWTCIFSISVRLQFECRR